MSRRKKMLGELDDDVRQHIEIETRENIESGMTPEEAHYAALRKFGNPALVKEQVRDVWGWTWLERFLQDLRFGWRQLRRSPGFTVVAVLSLALGIGANSTIFSVIDALLYRPLPYEHPGRLVVIWATEPGHPDQNEAPPIAESVDWSKQNDVFEKIGLTSFNSTEPAAGLGAPQLIESQAVTPAFFDVLGVKPILGRVFLAQEAQDRAQTVVISDRFWKSHFNRDPKVLGKSFRISGVVSTIVGVMPPGFAPFYGQPTDLWEPINPQSARYSKRIDHWLMPVARLKAGVTLQQAQAEMNVIPRRLARAYPATNKGVGKRLVPLQKELFGETRGPLYMLLGAVGFVLLIACVNVANLLQSRTEGRRKEYALRASLGAGRKRLVQQLLVESGLLAMLAGAFGVLLTFAGIRVFLALAEGFPLADRITVNGPVLEFTLAVSILTVLLFGLAPALRASSPNLDRALREGERRTAAGSRGVARHGLVICEVALAMVLLVGAGLMINTMLHLQRVDPGFDPNDVLAMAVNLPEGRKYVERVPGGDWEKWHPAVNVFHQQLLERVAALPGVESAGFVSGVPTRWADHGSFSVVGQPPPSPDHRPQTAYTEASPGYFRTMRIPLIKGRYLDERDTESTPWVIDVSEAFVRRYFPNQDPIGKAILMRYGGYEVDEVRPREIVGVVGDVKQFGLGGPPTPFLYTSYFQQPVALIGGRIADHLRGDLVVRTTTNLHAEEPELVAAAKKIVAGLDPDLPVTGVTSLNQVMEDSIGDYRFLMQLLGIFASMALLLAVIGIYGVISYFVADRTHEIGIRVALGAQRADVLRLIARLGLTLSSLGVAIGLGLAFGLTRLIAGALFGVKPADPVTYAAVAVSLMAVAFLASYIPAHRATTVDPMVALRHE